MLPKLNFAPPTEPPPLPCGFRASQNVPKIFLFVVIASYTAFQLRLNAVKNG